MLVGMSRAFAPVARRSVGRRLLATLLPDHLSAAKEELASGSAMLLDVREKHEWDQAHFKSAVHVPLSDLQKGKCPGEVLEQGLEGRLYLHCAAGVRVHPSAALLASLGCGDIVPLREGIAELYQYQFDDLAPKKNDQNPED